MNKMDGDTYVDGTLYAKALSPPPACIGNAAIKTGDLVDAEKLEQQYPLHYWQADGSDVAAAIVPIHTFRGDGEILDIEVVCLDAPEGGDKTFTVDLQVANVGTPTPASVLDAVITYPIGAANDCAVQVGVVTDADRSDGDTLIVVVALLGSTGNQGQGLVVNVHVREEPE